jgi:hypothetical protein
VAKCRYCPEEGLEAICLSCRTKFENLEAENARLRKDVAYLRQLAAGQRAETRREIHRKMRKE